MAAQQPSIPKGTRDFSPAEVNRREYIFETLKGVFRLFGFQPIETPAMENLSTLLGKYGEEGDKLLFKILNSGDFLAEIPRNSAAFNDSNAFAMKACDKGLRYDLTVPFARYVVQHQNDIVFPFKRFQVQPVWRADRPQKGRYREFFQCDVDVIGSNSLLNELELLQIIDEAFHRLDLKVLIKINNRKILTGIAEAIGEAGKIIPITIAIDKLEKIGLEKVKAELALAGIAEEAISRLIPLITLKGGSLEKLNRMKSFIAGSETGLKGISELEQLFSLFQAAGIKTPIELDLSLARGLNYYTGAIIEVKSIETELGSICGGGRYDDLTGVFGLPGISGVGVSFGADRIYDVLLGLGRFPEAGKGSTKLLFVNFGEKEVEFCLPVIHAAREAGIRTELYPDASKMRKQLGYANDHAIPFVAIVGEDELKQQLITLKNMGSGEQFKLNPSDLIRKVLEK